MKFRQLLCYLILTLIISFSATGYGQSRDIIKFKAYESGYQQTEQLDWTKIDFKPVDIVVVINEIDDYIKIYAQSHLTLTIYDYQMIDNEFPLYKVIDQDGDEANVPLFIFPNDDGFMMIVDWGALKLAYRMRLMKN